MASCSGKKANSLQVAIVMGRRPWVEQGGAIVASLTIDEVARDGSGGGNRYGHLKLAARRTTQTSGEEKQDQEKLSWFFRS